RSVAVMVGPAGGGGVAVRGWSGGIGENVAGRRWRTAVGSARGARRRGPSSREPRPQHGIGVVDGLELLLGLAAAAIGVGVMAFDKRFIGDLQLREVEGLAETQSVAGPLELRIAAPAVLACLAGAVLGAAAPAQIEGIIRSPGATGAATGAEGLPDPLAQAL